MSEAPFACVVTNGRQVWYRTLLEAVESSTTMLENDVPHRLLARDIHGEMQELGQGWRPDCVCGQEDSFGGDSEQPVCGGCVAGRSGGGVTL